MFERSNYRDNPINWSMPAGQPFGIRLRIHVLFLFWILFQLFRSHQQGMLGVGAVILLMLFVVVLIHEFGHCYGASVVGGGAEEILLWPLGGLASVHAPMTPRAQFITTAAGPMVNVIFCSLTAPILLILGGSSAVPLNPFNLFAVSSASLMQWGAGDWLGVFWSVNYLILLFNLLPTFPMDGGRLLQAVVWKYRGFHVGTMVATFVGMVGAMIFGVVGLLADQMILVCIAIFGYITCMQQRQMLKAGALEAETDWSHDFSMSYGDSKEQSPSWLARRRAAKLAERAERDLQRQEQHEKHIDEILDKVHREGMHSLTPREKKILQTATKRKKSV